jgi:predicted ATPase/class 3 adenylate cyclase
MASTIRKWLESFELGQYAETFEDNDLDLTLVVDLSDADLRDLGVVSMGHRKRLLRAIEALRTAAVEEPFALGTAETEAGEEAVAAAPQAERRQLTVMFCDLVGSTELSSRLDPEDLREVMRRYQDTVAGVVTRFEGHVAKFLGDGVLAFFGWPRAYEDQAERAVRSGLAAAAAVASLKTEDGQTLEARVGIATGQVVIGDIVGEGASEADAVAGETPNLAARLLEVASPGQVVIGTTTRLLIGEALDLEDLRTYQLKGFAEPVPAWRVIGDTAAERPFQAVHPDALTRLVGREPELALLRRAWEQSQAGIGQVVLISGEPGIGKSRLMDALGVQLKDERNTRITLGCSPYHTNSALYPLIVHLERALRWQREDDAEVKLAKLEKELQGFSLDPAEVIPLYAPLLSLPLPEDRYPPLELTPQEQKQRTLDAIVAWLMEEAERRPVLQVWEDLHWADPSTLELLTLEIEQAPTAPILNVLTFRPDFQPPWPQRSHMTPLTLNRLERPEVEALIGLQAGGKVLPEEVIEHIVSKTDGVPLYIEELTKTILEADFLRERNGSWELTGELSEVTIPATLQDSLMARLDRLPMIREVAQLGAVLGREFAYEMVQAIVSIEESMLQEGLAQLVDAELLYQRGRPPRAKYIFKHALVQDAAYQSLLKRTRRYYHRQVAELIEARFPETVQAQPELVAHHYTEARLPVKSVPYWYKAGQQAIERSANLEAIAHLTRGRALLAEQPASAERAAQELDYCLALGPALMSTKGLAAPEAEEVYLHARQLCQSVDQAALSFQAAWGLWLVYQQRGQIDMAQSATDEVLSLAERQRENVDYLLQAHHAAWTTQLFVGNISESRTHIVEGDALYDIEKHRTHAFTYGGHDPGVCAKTTASEALCLLGYAEQAVQHAADGVELAERLSHPFTLAMARYFVAQVHQYRLEADIVHSHAQAAVTMCESHGFESFRAQATVLLGWATAAGGESEPGIEQIREGLAAWQSTGTGMRRPYFLALLADALLRVDRFEEGLNVIAEAEALIDRSGETRWWAETVRLKGALMGRAGAARGDIEATYQRALGIAHGQEARLLELRAATSLGRFWHGQGKASEARELLGPLYVWFTEGLDTPDLKDAKALFNDLA